MKAIVAGLLLLVLGLTTGAAAAVSPEDQVVAVVSVRPVSDVPGLLTGRQVMDRLNEALEIVRSGVPDAARPILESLNQQLRAIAAGEDADHGKATEEGTDGQPWLPVEADELQVMLDAPVPEPRPSSRGAGDRPGNLPARARRTRWLPVTDTQQKVEDALAVLVSGEQGQIEAQRLLDAASQATRIRTELEQRPLILAYYEVQSALTAMPKWEDEQRDALRRAAESLDGVEGLSDLAAQLQARSDAKEPDARGLHALAAKLRTSIEEAAGPLPMPDAPENR